MIMVDYDAENNSNQETNLFNSSDDEVLAAKARELSSWKSEEVYKEVEDTGQNLMSLRWVVTPKTV